MSYDLEVFAPGETPPEKSILTATLRKHGWHAVYLHSDAFWKEEVWPFLPNSGPLESGHILLAAWPQKNTLAPQLESLVRARNFAEFKQLAESSMALAACSLTSTIPYNAKADYSDQEWQHFETAAPDAASSANHPSLTITWEQVPGAAPSLSNYNMLLPNP